MSLRDRVLGLVGRGGALPGPLAVLVEHATGYHQVLTRRPTIDALLGDPAVHVPYGPDSRALGLGGFPLACDGPQHATARARVAEVLDGSAQARHRGEEAAGATADAALLAAGPRLDVVAGLVDPALEAWVETWFGLPGRGPELTRLGRLVLHTTALAPRPRAPVDHRARAVARRAVDAARAALAAEVRAAPVDSLAWCALEAAHGDLDTATSDILGLTVGPLALGSWSLTLVVDALLDRAGALQGITSPAEGAWLYDRLAARHAPLPGLPRLSTAPIDVEDDRGERHRVPAGPVLAATSLATRAEGDARPPGTPALAFGSGPHRCMGRADVTAVAGRVLHALAPTRPQRVPGPRGRPTPAAAPSGVHRWRYPGHLVVELGR